MAGRPKPSFRLLLPTVISFIPRLWLVGSFALAGIDLSAETTPPSSEVKSNAADLLSPYLKAALSTGRPAYKPVKPGARESAELTATMKAKTDTSDGELLVLPSFMVRGPRPPKPADLLTLDGKLDHYLGPKDGFDRGLLNRVVLQWGNGPATVSLFNAVKNETRAKTMYADDERLRNRVALLDLVSLLKETGDAALSDRLKSESDSLFFRKPAK